MSARAIRPISMPPKLGQDNDIGDLMKAIRLTTIASKAELRSYNASELSGDTLPNGSKEPSANGKADAGTELAALCETEISEESLEDVLRSLWADVLDIDLEEITLESHFFELGGDSLATAKIAALSRRRELRITREMVFQAPIFEDMLDLLSKFATNPSCKDLPPESVQYSPFSLIGGDVQLARQLAIEQCGVASEDIEDLYPATALQAGLMARSISASGAYISSWLVRLLQPLDVESLSNILHQAVQRLPILRTAMVTSAEHGFVQVILPPPSIEVIRVPSTTGLDLEALRPSMALGKPLSRFAIVVSEDSDKLFLLWHAHHAIYDMSSLELVSQHIQNIALGMNPAPSSSFASFVAHTIEVRTNPEWRGFWLEQLQDCPTAFLPHVERCDPTDFRTDARYTHPLTKSTTKTSFTLANVFRAAWAYLLSCYEQTNDVVFGVTSGGRYAAVPNCAEIVGPTISTVPCRVRMKPNTTVHEFLQQITMQAVQMNSWEQVGLTSIQSLGPDGQKACRFRSLVNVQIADAGRENALWEPVDPDAAEPMDYALVLELFSRDAGDMRLRISYDSTVLRRQQVAQIASQLEGIVTSFIDHPTQTLSEVGGSAARRGSETLDRSMRSEDEPPRPFELLDVPTFRIRKHAAVECGVSEAAIEDVLPCTPMQSDLMTTSLRHPSTHVSQIVLSLRKDLADEDFCRAWASIKYVHHQVPALRTRFFYAPVGVSGSELQVQMMQAVVEEEISWTGWEDIDKYLAADRNRGFRPGQALSRIALIHDPADGQVRKLVLTVHRAVCDSSCAQLLVRSFENVIKGTVDVTQIVSRPYNTFVRHVLRAPYQESKTFWTDLLAGSSSPSFPEVPVGHVPISTAALRKKFFLPRRANGLVEKYSNLEFFQIAWALTLTQYYDSNDVVFGSLLSGRDGSFANLLGPTESIVPQRLTFGDSKMTLAQLFRDLSSQNHVLQSYAHCGVSKIRAMSTSCAAACRFQNLLALHEPLDKDDTTGHRQWFRTVEFSQATHSYPLVLEANPSQDFATCQMNYDTAILEEAQVRRLMSHMEHMLRQLADLRADDNLRLKDLSHMPEEHLADFLSWNKNVPPPLSRGVHELFEERMDSQPDAPAVCARDGDWTYAQLDDLSEKLARSLRSMGVSPGTYVPLLFEKCGLAIICMLAILKAGGASVALDPSHPPERLRGLISGMGSCMVVCSSQNHDLAIELGTRAFALTTQILEYLSKQPKQQRLSHENAVDADNTAFVLFTSGSTGMPKGILIPHRAFSSSIRGHSEVLRFSTGPGSRNFQFTAHTSDVSIGEIFTSLAVGSCVCVPSDWDRKNNVAGTITDMQVNWAFFTPSVATLLNPAEVPCLRTMVFGGETATPENIQTWVPALNLINSFGPAECSIWTHCIPRPVKLDDIGSNIGYSVGGATWITDPADFNRLLPIGATGELLFEGPNIADGYMNEPDKTANTFVKDPTWMPSDRKTMRLYRSGDLARFLPNGMVQFLGRRDHQVKVNGLRIELGEIEHQIRRLTPDDILVAVEVVQPAGSGKVLTAFLGPKNPMEIEATTQTEPSSEDQTYLSLLLTSSSNRVLDALQGLEEALTGILPTHMVPKAFVPLREMPLTASAKTDRKVLKHLASLLPAEELSRLGSPSTARQAPSSVKERVLARLWSEALGRSLDLDVHQNFFKVGGDSLSAMKLVSFARKANVVLSVEQVFKFPALRDMAEVAVVEDHDEHEQGPQHLPTSSLPAQVASFSLLSGEDAVEDAMMAACEQLGVDKDQIEDIYPCSPLQEGLLALSQDGRGTYVAQMVYELPDDVDLKQFESAWATVISDWPILRTRFFQLHGTDGTSRLMQAVVKSRTKWLKARSLADYLKLDKRDKMQLGDRMLRLAALRDKKDNKNYFVMTAHHAIYDGWELVLLFSAVRRAYLGLPRLETMPPNVFISHLESRDRDRSQRYWQTYLAGASRTSWPELPSPDFRPSSTAVQTWSAPLPAEGPQKFTFATLMRTAFALLLGAYSHSEDVVFTSTVHGRALGHNSAEKVAAPTLATVPVRVNVGRESLIHDILSKVQSEGAEMLEHEQEGMQNIKRYNRNALATIDAQSLLVVQVDPPPVDPSEAGLTMTETNASGLDNGFLSSALVLEATASDKEMRLVATHDDRVINKLQAGRIVRQLAHLVVQLSESSPESRFADIAMVAPEDKEEMFEWNAGVPVPSKSLIHELFREQARQQPSAEALVSLEGTLTFQQLDVLSDKLAAHLWSICGLRQRLRIPLFFEKSIWTVVAMLGVLKIGSAYVALNPAHPPDRLRSLMEDVDAEFALCSERFQSLAADVAPRTFCVGPATSYEDGSNDAADIKPDDHAFFLFTSGSTGKPKAIMIDHTAFCSSMRGHGETLCYQKGHRNLQYTAYTSDVSMGEIFTSLTRGATVCVPSDEERLNDLAGAMERMHVDWAFLTPSVATLLNPDHVPSLRTLLFGGETATVTNVKTWSTRLHLINSFGPAETSIWSHAHPHFTETDDGSDIGWSVGCATWIVDPSDYTRLMPIGAIGELVVEGPNIAAGYYRNPEKTKAAFVEQLPFLPPDRRNRIYRLGDLARWMPDGRVQFLGRIDGQVKLHGQRIEVGEVEHNIKVSLASKGKNLEVAVEMIKNPEELNDSRLIAFISCVPADQIQDRENAAIVSCSEQLEEFGELLNGLKESLAKRIATYMIPTFFVPLTAMPLNASAKTDRKHLRGLVSDLGFSQLADFALSSRKEIQPPQTAMEKLLHNMWCSVLALPPDSFGVEADFFETGGDSIAAMKLASIARSAKVTLAVQDIYDRPKLGMLSQALEKVAPRAEAELAVIEPFSLLPSDFMGDIEALRSTAAKQCSVKPAEVLDVYPCTPTQQALIDRTLKSPGAFWLHNVFEMPPSLDAARLETAWQRIVEAHDILRTRIYAHSERYLQVVLQKPNALRHITVYSLQRYCTANLLQPLKYGEPLMRAAVLTEAVSNDFANKRYLVVTFHHSVYDIPSLAKIFTELEHEYGAIAAPDALAKPTDKIQEVSYKHFVKALLDQDRALVEDFWKKYLLGTKTTPFVDPPTEEAKVNRVLRHKIPLAATMSQKGSGSSNVTHAVLAYAALGLALHRQLASPDTVLRLVSMGRTAAVPDIAEIVGPTLTWVPLRMTVNDAEMSLQDYLTHVTAQARRSVPYEQIGWKDIGKMHSDAEAACAAATQVVLHPYDPYSEQLAGGLGLRRRELSAFSDDGVPVTVDIALIMKNKALESLSTRIIFDDRVVSEESIRWLMIDFEIIAQAISKALANRAASPSVQDILQECDSKAVQEKVAKQMVVERIEDRFSN